MVEASSLRRCVRASLAGVMVMVMQSYLFCLLGEHGASRLQGMARRDSLHERSEVSRVVRQENDPDSGVSRYNFEEYRGIYKRLISDESWPRVMRIVVVGPRGDGFRQDVQDAVIKVLGWDPITVTVDERTRWQSMRLDIRFINPDDFCALHSYLQTIDGIQSVL
ncbi:unnamed protein product [Effrenium voratum]|uniref:Uncharacterized protein n=1 Tax=Effrenium voratum TaxID=2562239 RepID=A0AA36MLA1_9DINO|nr:unnamed protein product [Effrenium voratum]CAJ1460679.1 unnamed protein product [Effrenium voratum]